MDEILLGAIFMFFICLIMIAVLVAFLDYLGGSHVINLLRNIYRGG